MVALSKEQKARESYVQSATVIISGDIALVHSEHEKRHYLVHTAQGKSIDCECGDFVYRKAHCKHQKAVELRLVPAPKRVRRSAVNSALVASMQLPEGLKVRKARKGAIGVAPKKEQVVCKDVSFAEPVVAPVEVVVVPVEKNADELLDSGERAAVYLREHKAAIEAPRTLPKAPKFTGIEGRLNGNRAFSVLR